MHTKKPSRRDDAPGGLLSLLLMKLGDDSRGYTEEYEQ